MFSPSWEQRMERAALKGAVTRSPTLGPFIAEALEDAQRELDETETALSDAIQAVEKSLGQGS